MRVRIGILLCAVALALAFGAGYMLRGVVGTYDECDDARSSYYHALERPGISDAQLSQAISAATLRCGHSPQAP